MWNTIFRNDVNDFSNNIQGNPQNNQQSDNIYPQMQYISFQENVQNCQQNYPQNNINDNSFNSQYTSSFQNVVSPTQYNDISNETVNNIPNQAEFTNIVQNDKNKTVKTISKRTASVIIAVSIILSMGIGFGGGIIAKTVIADTSTSSTVSGDGTTTASDDKMVIQKVENTVNTSSNNQNSYLTTAEVAEIAADSVVEIRTETVISGSYMHQYVSEGAGSGVIVSENGYIITNHHVIEDATSISVTLKNGNSYTAKLIGSDSELDVALLKIEETGLKSAIIGSSENLKVGEDIVAIGNPLGQLGGTVTEGIVSALDRDITIDNVTNSLLQISAAINPGNSGGGVFNCKGELVALVVAKSIGDDVEGLGFAIPIDDVVDILDDLYEYGYVKGRVMLDVTLIDISTQDMAWQYRVSELGVYIYQSNASGLKSGDRIISIDGEEVYSSSDVKSIIKEHSVGEKLTFVVERDNSEISVEVELLEKTQS